ncbi:hypothetical protein ABZ299_19100 [Streptomyces sp. NPDC006184]|uniref:hypothetical protein n=1 Tax=Streptomyces sp. NPDC006184 TaxID=3155455 RepID=UPI0033AD165B
MVKPKDAATAAIDRVDIYERLVQVDAGKYKPDLAAALVELSYYFRAGLDSVTATAFAAALRRNARPAATTTFLRLT